MCLHLSSHNSSWWGCCRTGVMTDNPNLSVSTASEVSVNHTNELTSVKRAHNVQKTQLNLPRINLNFAIEDWQFTFATLDILFSVFSLKVRQQQKIGSTTTCLLRCNYVLSFLRLVHRDIFLSVPTERVHTHKQAHTHMHSHTHTHIGNSNYHIPFTLTCLLESESGQKGCLRIYTFERETRYRSMSTL